MKLKKNTDILLKKYSTAHFIRQEKSCFFRFYKEFILKATEIPPGKGFYALKTLQDYGLIDSIITRRIAGLEDRAGCRNVLNMKGTVYENVCPHLREKILRRIYERSERSSALREVHDGHKAAGVSVRGDDQ